ncbi:MAG: hypothetical protein P8J27_14535 [Mariniblastus sp.]|nr:hypothetical protein [Mariniblastus sp.]
MKNTAPHYLLFTEAKSTSHSHGIGNRWRFVLEEIGTSNRFEEADEEPGVYGERLQLFAAVRGLEAIEQPSRVTLITSSKHVGRGIRRSLTLWKENDWQWERFGVMALIKDHDLWKRIDMAMEIHQINCRVWQFDPPHVRTQAPQEADQARLLEPSSPFVSPINSCAEFEEPVSAPIHSEKLTLRKSRRVTQQAQNQSARIPNLLDEKVKPIGQGRAYGYAVN